MSADRQSIIAQLIALSRDLGREDRELAILAEGNTSARISEETFVVKASGARLGSIDESGLVECRFEPLLKLLTGPVPDDAAVEQVLLDARVDPSARKPSVEAVFHAQLLTIPGITWVGHTHPIAVNAVLCSPAAGAFAEQRRFPDEIVCCGDRSPLVPYVDPGVPLARAIAAEVGQYTDRAGTPPRVILLQNHGMIAPAGSPANVLAATLMAQKAARIYLGARAMGGATGLTAQHVARIAGRPDEHYRRRELER